MPVSAVTANPGVPESPPDIDKLKRSHAASDFESLLIAQMLRSVRSASSGWLGGGEDQASDAAFGIGEEELAKTIAASGGLGLAKLIESGLSKKPSVSG